MNEEFPTESPTGLIGKLVSYFINSQITILLIAGLMVLGIMAIAFTPKEENPQISVPAADIYLTYLGAPAKVVEETVIVPVEGRFES